MLESNIIENLGDRFSHDEAHFPSDRITVPDAALAMI